MTEKQLREKVQRKWQNATLEIAADGIVFDSDEAGLMIEIGADPDSEAKVVDVAAAAIQAPELWALVAACRGLKRAKKEGGILAAEADVLAALAAVEGKEE